MKHANLYCFTLLIGAFFCPSVFAQPSGIDYNLSDYTLPYLKRQTLELDFSLTGDVSDLQNFRSYGTNGVNLEYHRDATRFGLSLDPTYTFYLNSPRYQLEQRASFDLTKFDYRSDDVRYSTDMSPNFIPNTNTSDMHFSYSPFLRYEGELREFIAGKFFLEQDLFFAGNYGQHRYNKEIHDTNKVVVEDQSRKTDNLDLEVDLNLLAGWGRIERVEDARLAVYILNDLEKAGRLSREVNDEDIRKLSQAISTLKNERFFDFRHKRIWELEQLDSVTQAMGMTDTTDISYFTLLNDNWLYAEGPERQSGFQVSAGPHVRYIYGSSDEWEETIFPLADSLAEIDDESYGNTITMGALALIRYEKPINLYWQFSFENRFIVDYFDQNRESIDRIANDTITDEIQGLNVADQLYCALSYYPNSRTNIRLYASNSFGADFGEENPEGAYYRINSIWGINTSYYISPQLRLDLSSAVSGNYSKFTYSDSQGEGHGSSWNGSLNVGLVYKIL